MKRAMALIGRKRLRIALVSLLFAGGGGYGMYLLENRLLTPGAVWSGLVFGLLALLLQCLGVLVADLADDSVNSPERLKMACGAPVLTCIPHCTGANTRDDASIRHLAESYNCLRNNAGYVSKGGRVFAVTSATSGDGKTTVAINLAKSLITGGHKVAVVDADMRSPSVHRRLRLKNTNNGLAEALEFGDDAVFVRLRDCPSLYVLRAGQRPDDPSFLLRSNAMYELLDELLDRFDYIVIDAPPVLPVPDCAALAQNIDWLIFVARYGRTSMLSAARARNDMDIANAGFLGAVLNDVPAAVCRSFGARKLRRKEY